MAGPLSGIRVVELGQVIAGPFCGQLLGDYGAEVIKIEPPGTGDVLRQWGHADVSGDSLWWSVAARNKRSVTVDLRTPEGQQLVRDLVAHADILVENFRPGTLERWGLGWDELSGDPARADHGADQRLRADGPVRPAGRLRLDRRGDGRAAGAHRLPGPAADPGRHQHRRLAHRHVRRAGSAGRAGGTPPHRPRSGRRREHLRVGAGGDRVAGRGVVRARARCASAPARRCPGSPRATSTRPATARSSSPRTRTRCSRGWPR